MAELLSSSSSSSSSLLLVKKKRAKARWQILRSAIQSIMEKEDEGEKSTPSTSNDSNNNNENPNEYSIHRFPGFRLLDRKVVVDNRTNNNDDEFVIKNDSTIGGNKKDNNNNNNGICVEYSIYFDKGTHDNDSNSNSNSNRNRNSNRNSNNTVLAAQKMLKIRTREKNNNNKKAAKITSIRELMSHRYYNGVDNTGNTRVWDSATTLAHTLLFYDSGRSIHSSSSSLLDGLHLSPKMQSYILTSRQQQQKQQKEKKNAFSSFNDGVVGLKSIFSLAQQRRQKHNTTSAKTIRHGGDSRNNNTEEEGGKILNVVELGAGMAGIPSLFLVALNNYFLDVEKNKQKTRLVKNDNNNIDEMIPTIHVTITDGHPTAVENNRVCAQLTSSLYRNHSKNHNRYQNEGEDEISMQQQQQQSSSNNNDCTSSSNSSTIKEGENNQNISVGLLLWKANNEGAVECASLARRNSINENHIYNKYYQQDNNATETEENERKQQQPALSQQLPSHLFDLCLVSDCTHFTEFHAGLAASIGRLLRIGGVCILCQPCRSNTLELFLALIDDMNNNNNSSNVATNKDGGNDAIIAITPLFRVRVLDDYNDTLKKEHLLLVEENKIREKTKRGGNGNECSDNKNNDKQATNGSESSNYYDPKIHYPLLVVLEKLRKYDEDIDTKTALEHMKSRQQ